MPHINILYQSVIRFNGNMYTYCFSDTRCVSIFRALSSEVSSLKDQISAFKASLEAKDSVVMSMADKLQQLESSHTTTVFNTTTPSLEAVVQAPPPQRADFQQLTDQVEGYKLQNRFLNQEILELNKLKQESSSMVDDMLQTCVKLETKYYDVHRKYLLCLKELGKAQEADEGGQCLSEHVLEHVPDACKVSVKSPA